MLRFILVFVSALFVSSAARADSLSLGNPTHGQIQNAVEVPVRGIGFRFLPKTVQRNYRFAIPELKELLLELAKHFHAEYPGFPIQLGNLSKDGGGNIPQSRSHNSGRDADLAFHLIDRREQPVIANDLIAIGDDLRAESLPAQFQSQKNWAMVKHLLESDTGEIAWIFVYEPLRIALLKEAAQDSYRIQLKATTVLKQPSDSSPHDDHFHVRIYCPLQDMPSCEDGVQRWPWITAAPELPPSTDQATTLADLSPQETLASLLTTPLPFSPEDVHTLERLTNHRFPDQADWVDWWKAQRSSSPRAWIEAGYQAQGCSGCMQGPWNSRIQELISNISTPSPASYHARKDLAQLTGNPTSTWTWKKKKAEKYWKRWWSANRKRYGLKRSK